MFFLTHEKKTDALLLMISGEGKWCSTVFGRRVMGLYSYTVLWRTEVVLYVPSSSEIWRTFWFLLSAENYRFYSFIGFINFI